MTGIGSAPDEDRDGFRFRGGHVALDLAATLARRMKSDLRELLAKPADLDRWFVSSGLGGARPRTAERELELARELREAIYAIASGHPSKAAREQLNTVAALGAAPPQLTASGALERRGSASQLLATVATKAIELFGGSDAERIRQCEGSGCALLFLDQSRSGRRRWCSMQGCGNRAKAQAFRTRGHGADSND